MLKANAGGQLKSLATLKVQEKKIIFEACVKKTNDKNDK